MDVNVAMYDKLIFGDICDSKVFGTRISRSIPGPNTHFSFPPPTPWRRYPLGFPSSLWFLFGRAIIQPQLTKIPEMYHFHKYLTLTPSLNIQMIVCVSVCVC